jgi:hypothetical protein
MDDSPQEFAGQSLATRALMALRAAVEEVIENHIEMGLPIYVWRDGKVLEISPEELRGRHSPEAA